MSYSVCRKAALRHCAESTGTARRGHTAYHNGNKTFLFNKNLPPEKLKYLILSWVVIILKWKRQWKGLSTNMKAHIRISYALRQTRNKSSKLFNQVKNALGVCKHHKLAIVLTHKVSIF